MLNNKSNGCEFALRDTDWERILTFDHQLNDLSPDLTNLNAQLEQWTGMQNFFPTEINIPEFFSVVDQFLLKSNPKVQKLADMGDFQTPQRFVRSNLHNII